MDANQQAEVLRIVAQGVWQVLALPSWSPQSQPLVKALACRIRSHNLQLVTRSYTTISAPKLAMMLGIPQAEAAQGVQPWPKPWHCRCCSPRPCHRCTMCLTTQGTHAHTPSPRSGDVLDALLVKALTDSAG